MKDGLSSLSYVGRLPPGYLRGLLTLKMNITLNFLHARKVSIQHSYFLKHRMAMDPNPIMHICITASWLLPPQHPEILKSWNSHSDWGFIFNSRDISPPFQKWTYYWVSCQVCSEGRRVSITVSIIDEPLMFQHIREDRTSNYNHFTLWDFDVQVSLKSRAVLEPNWPLSLPCQFDVDKWHLDSTVHTGSYQNTLSVGQFPFTHCWFF